MKVLTIRIEMDGDAFQGVPEHGAAQVRAILAGVESDIYNCGIVGSLGSLKDGNGNTCGAVVLTFE
jgi:hypothetical protein